jgi:hypothetical protein
MNLLGIKHSCGGDARVLGWTDNRQFRKCKCYACGEEFKVPIARQKAKSGIKAGRITIGRGSVWGAGIV